MLIPIGVKLMPDDNMLQPFTVENWQERFSELAHDSTLLHGYMHALYHVLPTLEKMAKTKQNFDELKTELLNFCKGQRDLLKDIDEKWNSEDPEKYNLPRIERPDFTRP